MIHELQKALPFPNLAALLICAFVFNWYLLFYSFVVRGLDVHYHNLKIAQCFKYQCLSVCLNCLYTCLHKGTKIHYLRRNMLGVFFHSVL